MYKDDLGAAIARAEQAEKELEEERKKNMSEILDSSGKPLDAKEEEETVQEEQPQGENLEGEKPPTKAVNLPEMKCGYVVGIQPDGEFVFEVMGEEVGLIELMGLHKYADHRLEVAKDISQAYGPALISQQIGQMNQMVKVLLNMQTQQAKNNLVK